MTKSFKSVSIEVFSGGQIPACVGDVPDKDNKCVRRPRCGENAPVEVWNADVCFTQTVSAKNGYLEVAVACDDIHMVTYAAQDHRVVWKHHSDTLEQYLLEALQTLCQRRDEMERREQAAVQQQELDELLAAKEKERAVLSRFGIPKRTTSYMKPVGLPQTIVVKEDPEMVSLRQQLDGLSARIANFPSPKKVPQ